MTGQRDMTRYLGNGGMPLLDLLGLNLTVAESGRSEATWRVSELACNPRGAVQGGIFTVVLDSAMSLALHSVLPRSELAVSVDLTTSQPRAAMAGAELKVTGEVVKAGSTLIFGSATVVDADGETIAYGKGTFARRSR